MRQKPENPHGAFSCCQGASGGLVEREIGALFVYYRNHNVQNLVVQGLFVINIYIILFQIIIGHLTFRFFITSLVVARQHTRYAHCTITSTLGSSICLKLPFDSKIIQRWFLFFECFQTIKSGCAFSPVQAKQIAI